MKAQMSIVGFVMVFVMLVVFIALLPAIMDVITDGQAEVGAGITSVLLGLIPFFLVAVIIMSALWYVIPHREYAPR